MLTCATLMTSSHSLGTGCRLLYLVYNKAAEDEAKAKFRGIGGIAIKTLDAFALASVGGGTSRRGLALPVQCGVVWRVIWRQCGCNVACCVVQCGRGLTFIHVCLYVCLCLSIYVRAQGCVCVSACVRVCAFRVHASLCVCLCLCLSVYVRVVSERHRCGIFVCASFFFFWWATTALLIIA